MTIAKTTKNTILLLVFVAVFIAVLSLSLFVKGSSARAHEIPAYTANVEAVVVPVVEIVQPVELSEVVNGLASWYGPGFHGRRTASGAKYDMHALTAAHKSLPFGTLLRVVNVQNGKSVIVEVTDRGPFIRKRVVDLSFAAAKQIGVSVSPVELNALTPQDIEAFYFENDSTALVITSDMEVVQHTLNGLVVTSQTTSVSVAVKGMETDDLVVVRLNEKGKPVCFKATKTGALANVANSVGS